MPAGEYLAVALDYIEFDAWQDPEFLASVAANATRVALREGAPANVSLKVVVPKQ